MLTALLYFLPQFMPSVDAMRTNKVVMVLSASRLILVLLALGAILRFQSFLSSPYPNCPTFRGLSVHQPLSFGCLYRQNRAFAIVQLAVCSK